MPLRVLIGHVRNGSGARNVPGGLGPQLVRAVEDLADGEVSDVLAAARPNTGPKLLPAMTDLTAVGVHIPACLLPFAHGLVELVMHDHGRCGTVECVLHLLLVGEADHRCVGVGLAQNPPDAVGLVGIGCGHPVHRRVGHDGGGQTPVEAIALLALVA